MIWVMLKLWLLETDVSLCCLSLLKKLNCSGLYHLNAGGELFFQISWWQCDLFIFWCFPFRASTICCKASRPGSCTGQNSDFPVWSNWKPSASHLLEERRESGETAFLSSFLAVSSRDDFTWEKSILIIVLRMWKKGWELGEDGFLFFTSKSCAR